MEKDSTKSTIMMVCAMLIFGTIGIFRRYIPLPSSLLAGFRGICGALFLLGVCAVRRHRLTLRIGKKYLILLILSGAMIGFNWILLFEAYNYTSVATATLCYYMAPTLVVLVSPLVLGEKLTLRRILCAAAAVAGMLPVSGLLDGGGITASDLRGIVLGLGAAVLYAIVVILNKKLPVIDPWTKTIVQIGTAGIAVLPYAFLTSAGTPVTLTAGIIGLMLVVGFIHTGVAYGLYFGSMDGLRAQSIALLAYIDPVTALLLSGILLHEPLTPMGIVGAILILGAAALNK